MHCRFYSKDEKIDMNTKNRKVRYTRRVIREAYFKLLQEKPINKITIAEICELADIHRGTFYQHYHDIYDLQESIEKELMTKFDEVLPLIEIGKIDVAEAIVVSLMGNKDLCRALLGEYGSLDFIMKIFEMRRKYCYKKYEEYGIDKKDFNAIYTYSMSGCLGLIRDWVMNDYKEEPEYIVHMMYKLVRHGIEGMLPESV